MTCFLSLLPFIVKKQQNFFHPKYLRMPILHFSFPFPFRPLFTGIHSIHYIQIKFPQCQKIGVTDDFHDETKSRSRLNMQIHRNNNSAQCLTIIAQLKSKMFFFFSFFFLLFYFFFFFFFFFLYFGGTF